MSYRDAIPFRGGAVELPYRRSTVGDLAVILSNIPFDAEILDVFTDPWSKKTVLAFAHPSLPQVAEGDRYPLLKFDD